MARADDSPEELRELVANHGDQVRAVALDVTDSAAARRAVAAVTHNP
ncbi:hypothetical protein [Archangium violaceum]|nr:hypothetical protein [Archangium violaceum]